MSFHRNAKLGLAGRYALVSRDRGRYVAEAGRGRFSVSPATAHRWWHRWLEAGEGRGRRWRAVRSLEPAASLAHGSSPRSSPRRSAPAGADRLGAAAGAGATGFATPRSGRCSKRAGISRPPRPPREPANRYEWPCPGDLLHMDTRIRRLHGPVTASPATVGAEERQHRVGSTGARARRRPLPARLRRAPPRRAEQPR